MVPLSENLVIDEVQKSPGLLSAVKRAVDEDKKKRILLSGSANLLLMKSVSESLAGRALYFELLPFAYGEEFGRNYPEWISQLPEGMPPSVPRSSVPVADSFLFRGFLF
jgi:predicted AAA+ superfamily ATPase